MGEMTIEIYITKKDVHRLVFMKKWHLKCRCINFTLIDMAFFSPATDAHTNSLPHQP